MWYDFFANAAPEATFLMICHSRGCIQVNVALKDFPAELRNRIEVLAVSPGGVVNPKHCRKVTHLVSDNDFVPLLDMDGYDRCKHTIVKFTPHQKANKFLDHTIMSPTYEYQITTFMDDYTRRNRGK